MVNLNKFKIQLMNFSILFRIICIRKNFEIPFFKPTRFIIAAMNDKRKLAIAKYKIKRNVFF